MTFGRNADVGYEGAEGLGVYELGFAAGAVHGFKRF